MYTLLCGLVLCVSKLNSPATLHAITASPIHSHTHTHTHTHTHVLPALSLPCCLLHPVCPASNVFYSFLYLSKIPSILWDEVSLLLHATLFLVAILTYGELFLLCAADFLISCISEIPPVALSLTVKSFRAGPTFVSQSSIPSAVLGMEEVLSSRWRSIARKVEKPTS